MHRAVSMDRSNATIYRTGLKIQLSIAECSLKAPSTLTSTSLSFCRIAGQFSGWA
jgi:hypothetical protein